MEEFVVKAKTPRQSLIGRILKDMHMEGVEPTQHELWNRVLELGVTVEELNTKLAAQRTVIDRLSQPRKYQGTREEDYYF